MKISTRLMLLGGVLSGLLLGVGSVGLVGIGASNAALRTVYEQRTVPAGQLGDIGSMLLGNQLALSAALITWRRGLCRSLRPCAGSFDWT